jgi:hypothetical protein
MTVNLPIFRIAQFPDSWYNNLSILLGVIGQEGRKSP